MDNVSTIPNTSTRRATSTEAVKHSGRRPRFTPTPTLNRVIDGIARMERNIIERIGNGQTTRDAVEKCGRALDMDTEEFSVFQTMKSRASLDGGLTLPEAQAVYGFLGNAPATFNAQRVAVKVVLTKLFAELIARGIASSARDPLPTSAQ